MAENRETMKQTNPGRDEEYWTILAPIWMVSWRWILLLFVLATGTSIAWASGGDGGPWFFLFVLGGVFLYHAVAVMRAVMVRKFFYVPAFLGCIATSAAAYVILGDGVAFRFLAVLALAPYVGYLATVLVVSVSRLCFDRLRSLLNGSARSAPASGAGMIAATFHDLFILVSVNLLVFGLGGLWLYNALTKPTTTIENMNLIAHQILREHVYLEEYSGETIAGIVAAYGEEITAGGGTNIGVASVSQDHFWIRADDLSRTACLRTATHFLAVEQVQEVRVADTVLRPSLRFDSNIQEICRRSGDNAVGVVFRG